WEGGVGEKEVGEVVNIWGGGGLENLLVAAMGVYPYITASIIIQLLAPLIPALEEMTKEGEQGRQRMNRITFWTTVPLAYLQAYGQTLTLERSLASGASLFRSPFDIFANFLPTFTVLTSMVAGTMVLVWLGEQIQERGTGNGIWVIIFAGIVSRLPSLIYQAISSAQVGFDQVIGIIAFTLIALLTIIGIVLVQEGQRR